MVPREVRRCPGENKFHGDGAHNYDDSDYIYHSGTESEAQSSDDSVYSYCSDGTSTTSLESENNSDDDASLSPLSPIIRLTSWFKLNLNVFIHNDLKNIKEKIII